MHICPWVQRMPQPPQLFRSVVVSAQVIWLPKVAHIIAPVLQVHVPAAQVPSPQACPHVPQLLVSVWRLAQPPAIPKLPVQAVSPVGQVQAPETQVAPVPQLCPHIPQLAGSELVSVQVGLLGLPQAIWFVAQ